MKALVTGSAGHLGEALMRSLGNTRDTAIGLDIRASEYTQRVGSVTAPALVDACMAGVDVVFHSATLHKPHVVTHSKQAFLDTNVSGTLTLLEAACRHGVRAFVFTSTTSVYGDAMNPGSGSPAVWVTEALPPLPKNIYGVTKVAAEDLCGFFHRREGLKCIILRTSRFFPEEDDDAQLRAQFADANIKANEFLHRRVDIEDVVSAHRLAAQKAPAIGYAKYIVSASTPFTQSDLAELHRNAPGVVERRVPGFQARYHARGWKMFERIGRVYVNEAARRDLGWMPQYDFARVLDNLDEGGPVLSPLAKKIGAKGYHDETFEDGPYPVE